MRSYALGMDAACAPECIGEAMREGGPMLVADALAEFLADIALSRSQATLRTYRSLLRFPAGLTLPELDRAFCRRWLAERQRRYSPATAATCRGALASFCSWAVGAGWLAVSPVRGIPAARRPEPPVRVLNALALAKLREAAGALDGVGLSSIDTVSGTRDFAPLAMNVTLRTPTRRRRAVPSDAAGEECIGVNPQFGQLPLELRTHRGDSTTYRLILSLLLGTGLRVSELAGARWADLDRDVLRVRSKGGRYRRVVVPPDALALLESSGRRKIGDYTFSRKRVNISPESGTLLGMGHDSIYRRVKAVARHAGLPTVSPHWLRHAWATDYYRRGSLAHLQTLGGWANDREIRARYAKTALEDAALDEARRLLDG